MENTEYTLEYFINKFEAIPEWRWTIGTAKDELGRCCALGHCGAITSSFTYSFHPLEARALLDLTGKDYFGTSIIVNVNDGNDCNQEHLGLDSTPKQRVVNYLKSL